jgi:hypothetical protein
MVEPIVIDGTHSFVAAAEADEVGDLTLSGGVVHERDEAEIGIGEDGFETGGGFRMGEFTAEVEEVIGAEEGGGLSQVKGEDAIGDKIAGETVEVAIHTDADGVQDGGETESGHLGVVGEECGEGGPTGAAGLEVLFQVIGVEFHAAGKQKVAIEIDGFRNRGTAAGDAGDRAIGGFEGSWEDAGGADDLAVGEEHEGVYSSRYRK